MRRNVVAPAGCTALQQGLESLWPALCIPFLRNIGHRLVTCSCSSLQPLVLFASCVTVVHALSPVRVCMTVSTVGGMSKKRLHYVEGGQAGNREEKINGLIRAMN